MQTHGERIVKQQWRTGVVLTAGAGVAMMAGSALAEPFVSADPRNLGMGGAGVAVESGVNASVYNPALASPEIDPYRFSLNFPTVGVGVQDREEFIDAFDDFDDSNILDRTDDSFRDFNEQFRLMRDRAEDGFYQTNEQIREDLDELEDRFDRLDGTSDEFFDLLGDMSERPLTADFRGSMGLGLRVGQWGTALHLEGRGYGGGQFVLADEDSDLVLGEIDAGGEIITCFDEASQDGATPDEERLEECKDAADLNEEISGDLTSEFQAQGALMREIGFTLARDFDMFGRDVSFGVTPKVVDVDTVDYNVRVQDEDDVDLSDREQSDSGFTVDVGASMMLTEDLRGGVTVRNLIPQSYGTFEGNDIDVDPQLRAGVSWQPVSPITLAADMDLTENQPVGFGADTRFLSLGGEFDLRGIAQVRAGYRMNLASNDLVEDRASVGLGFSPGPVKIDVGAAGSSNDLAFFLQTGMQFRAGN